MDVEQLYLEHKDYLIALAQKYCEKYHRPDWEQDLLSAGVLSLVEHAEQYDPVHSARFTTFLYPYCRAAMQEVIDQNVGAFTYTAAQSKELRKAHAIYNRSDTLTEDARRNMVAEKMNISREKVDRLLSGSFFSLSLEALMEQDAFSESYFTSSTADPAKIIRHKILLQYLREAFEQLSFKEREIVGGCVGVFGHKKRSLADLGEQFQMREASVGRARDKALAKLRRLCNEGMFGYWRSLDGAIREFWAECAIADMDCGVWGRS